MSDEKTDRCGDAPSGWGSFVCTMPKGHDGLHGDGTQRWQRAPDPTCANPSTLGEVWTGMIGGDPPIDWRARAEAAERDCETLREALREPVNVRLAVERDQLRAALAAAERERDEARAQAGRQEQWLANMRVERNAATFRAETIERGPALALLNNIREALDEVDAPDPPDDEMASMRPHEPVLGSVVHAAGRIRELGRLLERERRGQQYIACRAVQEETARKAAEADLFAALDVLRRLVEENRALREALAKVESESAAGGRPCDVCGAAESRHEVGCQITSTLSDDAASRDAVALLAAREEK